MVYTCLGGLLALSSWRGCRLVALNKILWANKSVNNQVNVKKSEILHQDFGYLPRRGPLLSGMNFVKSKLWSTYPPPPPHTHLFKSFFCCCWWKPVSCSCNVPLFCSEIKVDWSRVIILVVYLLHKCSVVVLKNMCLICCVEVFKSPCFLHAHWDCIHYRSTQAVLDFRADRGMSPIDELATSVSDVCL